MTERIIASVANRLESTSYQLGEEICSDKEFNAFASRYVRESYVGIT